MCIAFPWKDNREALVMRFIRKYDCSTWMVSSNIESLMFTSMPTVVGENRTDVQEASWPRHAFSKAIGIFKADQMASTIAKMVSRSAWVPRATMIGSST